MTTHFITIIKVKKFLMNHFIDTIFSRDETDGEMTKIFLGRIFDKDLSKAIRFSH